MKLKAPLTNFDFMRYYKDNPKFGSVYSRDNLPRLKESFYIVNLDDKGGPGTHWVVVYNLGKNCIYFDSFGVSPPEEVLDKMRETGKQLVMNSYRIQDLASINCGFYCIYIIDQLLLGRQYIDVLTDFNPKQYIANDSFIEDRFPLP